MHVKHDAFMPSFMPGFPPYFISWGLMATDPWRRAAALQAVGVGELTVRASLWVESPIDDPTDAAQVAQIEADRKAAANLVAQQMGVSGDNAFLAPLLGLDDSSGATTVALLVDEEGVVAAAASGPQPEDCPSIASDNQVVYDEGYAEGVKTAEAQCSSNTTGAETVAGPVDDDATPESTIEVAGIEVPLFAGMIVVGFVVGSLLGLCIGVCAGRACGGGGNERNTQVAIPRDVSKPDPKPPPTSAV